MNNRLAFARVGKLLLMLSASYNELNVTQTNIPRIMMDVYMTLVRYFFVLLHCIVGKC